MHTITYIILGILVLVFFTGLNNVNTSNEPMNYLLRSFYHANLSHLVANGISFYGLSFIEDAIGSNNYLFSIVFIWVVSSMLLYIWHTIMPSRKIRTVGFSGIVFGLIVVYLSLMGKGFGLSAAGLAITILPQIFVSGISWEGHICGVIAGALYVMLFHPKKYTKDKDLSLLIKSHRMIGI